jgi:hypothetical protein
LDKTLRVWDLSSGQCLGTLEGHSGWVNSVSVTPDGLRAVSGSYDNTLRVWDLSSGRCLVILRTDAPAGASAVFSGRVVVGLHTGEVLIMEMRNLPSGPTIPAPPPAYATAEAYEQYLRRSLQHCRDTHGPDHESVLGHLAALAVHLEKTGQPAEAAEFQREHDALAARMAAKKAADERDRQQ